VDTIELPSGLKEVTKQLRREIFGYIQKKVGDHSSADDLTQDTFLRVERALAKGVKPEHFRGWIYQIARNAIIDWTKQRRRFVELEGEEKIAESVNLEAADSTDSEFRQALFAYAAKVIEGMPAEDREALTLTELDGFSREELANHLGISVSAAKSRVVRARAKLRKAVEDCCRLITDPYGKVIGWQRRGTDCCVSRRSEGLKTRS
jgi:RNA polymerase sigma-70 factor (ECF subfamily)